MEWDGDSDMNKKNVFWPYKGWDEQGHIHVFHMASCMLEVHE